MHDCKNELRSVDLKATPARLALLSVLEETEKPLDTSMIIDSLQKEGVDVDEATVFRIINLLHQKGIVKQVQLREGKFRYEHAGKAEHHHLYCEACGAIEDISDCNIQRLEKEIREKKQFLVKSHSLEFFGICPACRRLERQRLAGR
ncbi:MAG: transcriptional repressor [Candidatus Levybacteria bacterium]|nr:transcriptional repressor [Candidatus Levybacteria bacterium]